MDKLNKLLGKHDYKLIVLIILYIIISSCFFYWDTNETIKQGKNFWEALFSGNYKMYYSYYGSAYGILMVFFMGIWQLPLYIIEKLFKINTLDYFAFRLYGKLQLIIFLCISAYYLKKLAVNMGLSIKKANLVFWLYLTSIPLISTVCIIGQVDIIGMMFTIICLYYFFNKNKILFLIYFVLAVQCKYVPLFIIFPIYIFYEKKIIKILLLAALPFLVGYILNLPFLNYTAEGLDKSIESSKYEELIGSGPASGGVASHEVDSFLSRRVNIIGDEFSIPVFFIIFIMICMFAFLKETTNSIKYDMWCGLFFGLLGSISILFFIKSPYRTGHIVPFTTLFIVKELEKKPRLFFLEIIAYISLLFAQFGEYSWCFDLQNMRGMLLDILLPFKKFEINSINNIREIIVDNNFQKIWSGFYAIFVCWLIILAVYTCPFTNEKESVTTKEEDNRINIYFKIRTVINISLCCLSIFMIGYAVLKSIIIYIIK